jgi:hypothetical protein
MPRNNSIKIFISLLALIAAACTCFSTPATSTPSGAGAQQVPTPTRTVPANSICGWIDNGSSQTGAMSPTMTVWGTGQVLQLYSLEGDAIEKYRQYEYPANFRVYDPIYQTPDLLINFSSIEQVSSCP